MRMKEITKLQKAAEAVRYEWQMFDFIYRTFKKPGQADSQFKVNIMVEAFVIHAYCLYCFCYQNKSKYRDDIVAENFEINIKEFRKNRTPKNKFGNIKKRRDKEIAHLTFSRIYKNSKNRQWPIDRIHEYLGKTMWSFYHLLPEKYKRVFDLRR